MTTHREIEDRFDAYLDGGLSTEEAREVAAHLEGCAECTAALRRLGRLLDAAAALADREQQPGRDLWPAIRERMAPEEGPRRTGRRAPGTGRWGGSLAGLAGRLLDPSRPLVWASAVALALIVVYAATQFSRGPGGVAPGGPAVGEADRLRSETERARAGVDDRLPGEVGTDAAAEASEFRRNLALLDQAIRDSRRALEADPENRAVQRSLVVFYQRQLELLRWASRLFGDA